ncbi:MAG: hypothetical protein M3R69_07200 [Acidobacteriota bacterium]|nr:hypothetical protein [Acidobacteriota bacterium]
MNAIIRAEEQRQLLELKSHCERLLRTAEAKGIYPTPVDRLVEAAELVKSGDLALLEIPTDPLPQSLWRKVGRSLTELISKVKAGLFSKEKTIFINPNAHAASVPFATLHECTHHILPWQTKACVYLDDERTLDPHTRFRFEREANLGASYLLWQGDDYIKQALDLPITTATPVSLAQRYGGSVHSSMRYYVETHREVLILMVIKCDSSSADGVRRYELQYAVTSKSFIGKFGKPRFKATLSDSHILLRRTGLLDLFWEGEVPLVLEGVQHPFAFFGYQTPYNIFILLTPKRVPRRYAKAKVVVKT